MAFRLKWAETKDLTHDLACQIRDLPPSATEREVSETRLNYLREEHQAGTLVTFHWAIAELDGVLYRANGHHSSIVLGELNGTFPSGLQAHIDCYEVDDMESLGSLFRRFDARQSSRSRGDVAGAYQGLYAPVRDLNRKIAKLGLDGCIWHARHVENLVLAKGDDQYALFNRVDYHPFLQWLPSILDVKTPEMKKPPVVAAMYATFRKSEDAAKLFWPVVAKGGDEYNDNDPATCLDAWLKSAVEDKRVRELVKEPHLYQGCIFAWNAHRNGQQIAKIRTNSKKGFLEPLDEPHVVTLAVRELTRESAPAPASV